MTIRKTRKRYDQTLAEMFNALKPGDFFISGKAINGFAQPEHYCRVEGRRKGKIAARVMNGGWGMTFDPVTLIARPFGGALSQPIMVVMVGEIPVRAKEGGYSSVLEWVRKNRPTYKELLVDHVLAGKPMPKPHMVVPAVGVIVFQDDNVLLQQRLDTGEWVLPGGKIEKDQSVLSAMLAEADEELGLVIARPSQLRQISYHLGVNHKGVEFMIVYASISITPGEANQVKNMEPHKHKAVRWFNINQLPTRKMAQHDLQAVDQAIRNNQYVRV